LASTSTELMRPLVLRILGIAATNGSSFFS